MELNKKRQRIAKAFKVAIEGIVYTFKFNSLMKMHYILVALMIIGSFVFNISKVEKLLLVFTIGLIIVCEMVNIAIEKTIDMTTDENNELAKIAKDVASGGVAIATLNAIVATCVIFHDRLKPIFYAKLGNDMPIILIIVLIILFIGITTLKKDK